MADPFIGEIRMFGGNFAPMEWAFCDGAAIPISQNDVLFSLIGTTYGGDGAETFNLPNLQSRVPIHTGVGFPQGAMGGMEMVTLSINQIPSHGHVPQAANLGGSDNPSGAYWAASAARQFSTAAPTGPMSPVAVDPSGGSQPHDNMVPFLAINFIISLFGIYPTQT